MVGVLSKLEAVLFSRVMEGAEGGRLSVRASSCILRALMPEPLEALSLGLLAAPFIPRMRGAMSGEGHAETSDSSPPEVMGVSKPLTTFWAGAAGAMPPFFFFFLLLFIKSLLRMADKGSAAVPGGLMVNVRLGEISSVVSAMSVRSRSMAGMMVLVVVDAAWENVYNELWDADWNQAVSERVRSCRELLERVCACDWRVSARV